MKKYIYILTLLFGIVFDMSSCQDMLQSESDRQIFDPSLSEKTDSIFYTLGILKGVQQAIDQYVLINEMRGDLTQTNSHTSVHLRALANFSANTENKYDSAYVFYRIINNCNYFIAHRDTMLLTGSRRVSMPEYVQAKAIRAWTYMQLAKIYGKVPFYTTPITKISDTNANLPKKDLKGICDALAPDLAQYAGFAVPTYGNIDAGTTNAGETKTVTSSRCMFPVDLVLGDLYLETQQYEAAAKSYFNYLRTRRTTTESYFIPFMVYPDYYRNLPTDLYRNPSYTGEAWSTCFAMNNPSGVITYVPMAVNRLKGETTELPQLFGYDFYTTSNQVKERFLPDRQIDPSSAYYAVSAAQDYYYMPSSSSSGTVINTVNSGDWRRYASLTTTTRNDTTFSVMAKFHSANIPIYRTSGVYLRLAEALNRMGYPDAAFLILKDGFNATSANAAYLTDKTKALLATTIPFFSTENRETFRTGYGIHSYGSGYTRGAYSPYQMNTIVGKKMQEIAHTHNISVGTTLNDTINAVEDLICDEYALELAFEGRRFGDLCRLARAKNVAATYGTTFGSAWLTRKLAYKNPVVSLMDESAWYLPMQK